MSLRDEYQAEMAARDEEYRAALAFNARVFELARHNGYDVATYQHGGKRCWPVPFQLRDMLGCDAAVLP